MPSLPRSPTFWRIPVGAVLALAIALGVHEGNRNGVYRDVNGVPTACRGLTGPTIKVGMTFTDEQCRALESAYIATMAERMGHCVNVPLTFGEWVGYGSLAYNIGTDGFCHSSIVRYLKAGDHRGACARISLYVYSRKLDCRIRSNHCYGIVTRRAWERATCERDL